MKRPEKKAPCPRHPNKARFPRATAATFAAGQLSRERGRAFTPYECFACGDRHLTAHPSGAKNERTMLIRLIPQGAQ